MGDTFITDMEDFPPPDDPTPPGLEIAARFRDYLGAIVSAATLAPAGSSVATALACRRRPGHRRCGGHLLTRYPDSFGRITWQCSACDDNGYIAGWQGTVWDLSQSIGSRDSSQSEQQESTLREADIRECRQDEAEALLDLWQRAGATPSATDTPQAVRRVISATQAHVLVADIGGQLIGSIIGTDDGWRGNIYRLAVHPSYRRRGIARALVVALEERLHEAGVTRITALVEKDHSWATGFWEAVGYSLDRRMIRYVQSR